MLILSIKLTVEIRVVMVGLNITFEPSRIWNIFCSFGLLGRQDVRDCLRSLARSITLINYNWRTYKFMPIFK